MKKGSIKTKLRYQQNHRPNLMPYANQVHSVKAQNKTKTDFFHVHLAWLDMALKVACLPSILWSDADWKRVFPDICAQNGWLETTRLWETRISRTRVQKKSINKKETRISRTRVQKNRASKINEKVRFRETRISRTRMHKTKIEWQNYAYLSGPKQKWTLCEKNIKHKASKKKEGL